MRSNTPEDETDAHQLPQLGEDGLPEGSDEEVDEGRFPPDGGDVTPDEDPTRLFDGSGDRDDLWIGGPDDDVQDEDEDDELLWLKALEAEGDEGGVRIDSPFRDPHEIENGDPHGPYDYDR